MDSIHTKSPNDPRTGVLSAAGNDGLVDRLMQGAHEAVDRVGAKAAPALEKRPNRRAPRVNRSRPARDRLRRSRAR